MFTTRYHKTGGHDRRYKGPLPDKYNVHAIERRYTRILCMPQRISGFRGEFLWEWDVVEPQLLQLANAFEAGDYGWQPDTSARGVGEVLVHVACGTFMLLEWVGTKAPADLYPDLPEQPRSFNDVARSRPALAFADFQKENAISSQELPIFKREMAHSSQQLRIPARGSRS